MLQGLKSIVRGADHIARDQVCQDCAGVSANDRYAVAVVADGHGGQKYVRSETGSRFAVDAVMETVDAYMSDFDGFSRAIRRDHHYICKKMQEYFLACWGQKVEDHCREHELTEEERSILKKANALDRDSYFMYGSTVLFAVMTREYYYGMLVGDGGYVVVDGNGDARVPIEDERSYANYCSSICSRNALDAFREFYAEGRPISICVSTDGLIRSFASNEDFLDYHLLLASLLTDRNACENSLKKNLMHRTEEGSGDDISAAVIYDASTVEKRRKLIERCIQRNQKKRQKRESEAEQRRAAGRIWIQGDKEQISELS